MKAIVTDDCMGDRNCNNLLISYAFESQANTRYRFFSDKAHEGLEAPDKCPACVRPSGYFEILDECY